MKPWIPTLFLCAAWCAAAFAEDKPVENAAPPAEAQAPRQIEVAFVLDTTGSMGGLIDGAKQKIWQIANEIARGEPTPELKLALVGYRDRGDEFVTRITPLTDDLDAVYGDLTKFVASGGGDGPESVNQALHEAVHQIDWSESDEVLKIIFLVGDAPPHMDYEQDTPYPDTCRAAVTAGLIINTIQCGGDPKTTEIWKEIARLSEGEYVAIEQSGGMASIETPVDAELAELSRELGATVVAYGAAERQAAVAGKVVVAESAPAAAAADRMFYMRSRAGESLGVITGDGDLVAEVQSGRIDAEAAASKPAEELPEPMRKMSEAERVEYLEGQVARRTELQERVAVLTARREAYVREALEKQGGDGFDRRVAEIVQKQAARQAEPEAPAREPATP